LGGEVGKGEGLRGRGERGRQPLPRGLVRVRKKPGAVGACFGYPTFSHQRNDHLGSSCRTGAKSSVYLQTGQMRISSTLPHGGYEKKFTSTRRICNIFLTLPQGGYKKEDIHRGNMQYTLKRGVSKSATRVSPQNPRKVLVQPPLRKQVLCSLLEGLQTRLLCSGSTFRVCHCLRRGENSLTPALGGIMLSFLTLGHTLAVSHVDCNCAKLPLQLLRNCDRSTCGRWPLLRLIFSTCLLRCLG
jgi:hypothetical protein